MLLDSHAHFDGLGTAVEIAAAIDAARAAGVMRIIAVGGTPTANAAALAAAAAFPHAVFPALGFDRCQAHAPPAQADFERLADTAGLVAIGEIGLDYHYSPETALQQQDLLYKMLELACRCQLPAIVHSREADEATLAALRTHAAGWPGRPDAIGVLHCFTGSAAFAASLLELGFLISFSGIVTFRNAAALREVARGLPEDRLLIETDSPYLAPEPYRGRRNEPALVRRVAEVLAEVRGVTLERLAEITSRNAERLFPGVQARCQVSGVRCQQGAGNTTPG